MRTIYEILCGIIFVLLNITLVSVVYYYNRHPIKKYGGKKLKPEELSKVIAKEIGNQPQFYTYQQKDTGKYSVYVLSHTDNLTYQEQELDYPVDFDGVPAKPMSESTFKLTYNEQGFQVPGIKQLFNCPKDYIWDKKLNKCIEKPICNYYNDKVIRLYDRYYSEIDNPSITPITILTGKNPHPRLYIRCSSLQQKPIIEGCYKENEKVDENFTDNYDSNSIIIKSPCKVYDICNNYPDGTNHAYRINNIFSQALKINQYYKCINFQSKKLNCQQGYECNELSIHNNDICKPIDDCRPNIDYYFTTNPHLFYHCLSNKRQKVCCGENGIIKLSDNSYRCKIDNQYVYYPDNNFAQESTINGFKYKLKFLKGLQKTKLSWVTFDNWFYEKFTDQFKDIPYPSLQKTPIQINNNDDDEKFTYQNTNSLRKFYENLNDIKLPSKFYYTLTEDKSEKWTLFNEKELIKSIDTIINLESKIIHLSASNLMTEITTTIKLTNYQISNNPNDFYDIKIIPKDYGLDDVDLWIIFNGNIYEYIYKTGKTILFAPSSQYYSFIGAIIDPPKKISDDNDNKIIGRAFREVEGIYYAYCIKRDNNNFIFNDTITICHTNLNDLSTNDENITYKLSIDLISLKQNNILPTQFRIDEFTWDKLYIGKYYYDEQSQKLIVWHDHLFVLKLQDFIIQKLDEKKGKEFIIDEYGQFIYNNYPTNIVDLTFKNISNENSLFKTNKKYLTALATTFSYYNYNYEKPVVHWSSYIPINPACFQITQQKIDSLDDSSPDKKLYQENSILKYLNIEYPKVKNSTKIQTLLNIILLNQLTLTLDDDN